MMRGRPRQFDEGEALEAAMGVFWQKGYEGASCEDLLTAMGINSGSMYAAFGDKQSLYDRAFEHFCDTTLGPVLDILNGPGSPLENVRSLVRMWADFMAGPDRKGCFIDNTLIEFGGEKSGVAEMARAVTSRVQRVLEQKLGDAQETGELSDAVKPADMAAFLINTKQGLSVMSRAGAEEAAIRGVVNTTLSFLR
ncbi:MAG: TetR/AcrR family transcriptional regulator [Planctomycetes bacterium]|nr:TetR/AcrR family transcriptional regulator [Planctomycetota bacterium]